MSIYKRKDNWWIQFTAPNGERIQRSAGTQDRQQAQELHDRLKADAWRVKNVGAKERHSWQEAVIRWMTEQSHRKNPEDDKKYIRFLHHYLHDKTLDQIDKTLIDKIKAEKIKTGVSLSTVNHLLAFLKAILNKAQKDWEWIDDVPVIKLYAVKNNSIRWLTDDEQCRLIIELPDHLKAMMIFSLATGLRESNVTGLQWSQVDMIRRHAWINADQAKSKKPIAVPLNSDACDIIKAQIGKHLTHVFTYDGHPVTRANNHAWRKALKRAGIENFRWHDLRHTWASRHIQNGTPLHILKELGGWSDLSMVLRYAHLSSKHLEDYASNSKTMPIMIETNLLHAQKKA